jgi:hypothetical protein
MRVLLFRRIFDFKKRNVPQLEHRLNRRYTPGAPFPLRATLKAAGRDWPGRVYDVSAGGVGLLLSRDDALTSGLAGRLRLELDHHQLEVKSVITHANLRKDGCLCGIAVEFDDFSVQKAYLQLLQPIAIGSSLQPVAAGLVIQNEPRFTKLSFRGESNSVLSVWRKNTATGDLHSFEFMMQDYFVRADAKVRVLEVFTRSQLDRPPQLKVSAPVFDPAGGVNDEIRQLFRWIVPNLPDSVPADVRGFLHSFAV